MLYRMKRQERVKGHTGREIVGTIRHWSKCTKFISNPRPKTYHGELCHVKLKIWGLMPKRINFQSEFWNWRIYDFRTFIRSSGSSFYYSGMRVNSVSWCPSIRKTRENLNGTHLLTRYPGRKTNGLTTRKERLKTWFALLKRKTNLNA